MINANSDRGDALAYVDFKKYKKIRETREKKWRSFWYISPQKQIRTLGTTGGNLWVFTKRMKGIDYSYSLAYKLEECQPMEVSQRLKEELNYNDSKIVFGVQAKPSNCIHYPTNDLTYLLLAFRFLSNKPIKNIKKIGASTETIRWLNDDDVDLMNRYSQVLPHRRSIFLSYSREDTQKMQLIKQSLASHKISIWSDIDTLRAGDDWEERIEHAILNADLFVVLMSKTSANSLYVDKEIQMALKNYEAKRIKDIIPVVIDDKVQKGMLQSRPFNLLSKFNRCDLSKNEQFKSNLHKLNIDILSKLNLVLSFD